MKEYEFSGGRRMENRGFRRLFFIATIVVILLVIVLLYIFLIKPKFNGYIIEKQVEAKDLTLIAIVQQVQQQGYVQITMENKTLTLVPYVPQAGTNK